MKAIVAFFNGKATPAGSSNLSRQGKCNARLRLAETCINTASCPHKPKRQ
jgi:hypothetical protein